jgi:hypothetical protein
MRPADHRKFDERYAYFLMSKAPAPAGSNQPRA